jgi:hypothetical protein
MPQQRSPQEIRASMEGNRYALERSLQKLSDQVNEATDWRKQISEHRTKAICIGAAAGFVLAGGIGAIIKRRDC